MSSNLLVDGAADGMVKAVSDRLRQDLRNRLIREVLDPMLDEALKDLRVDMHRLFANQALEVIVRRVS